MGRRWLIAVVIALAIPIGCLVALVAAEQSMDEQWLNALAQEDPTFGGYPRDAFKLTVLCANPEIAPKLDEACRDAYIIDTLQATGIGVVILSGGLVIVALAIALISRGNRARMARLYRPGLAFFLVGIAVLLVLQGIVVVGTAYEVPAIITGHYLPWVIAAMGIAVVLSLVGMLRALGTMVRKRPLDVFGVALDRNRDSRLFDEVGDVAREVGTQPPDVVLAGLDPNCFVVDHEVDGLDGRHRGRVLFLSAPLTRLLSRQELRAIIGHELGHFRGEDTEYSKAFAPVYAASRESLGTLKGATRHWSGLPSSPALKLLEAFVFSFAESEQKISRERELAADAVGASAASPDAIASSLLKLGQVSAVWPEVRRSTFDTLRAGGAMPDVSTDFVRRARAVSAAGGTREARIPHPFDSHPTLDVRLEALGVQEADLQVAARDLDPADPASSLFGDVSALEATLARDLEQRLRGYVTATETRDEGPDPSASLREAAETNPAIAELVALFEELHGTRMRRPGRPNESWVLLTDVRLEVRAAFHPFHALVPATSLPAGDDLVIVDVVAPGGKGTDPLILPRGTTLLPIGYNAISERSEGREEDVYQATVGDEPRIVRAFGVGPIEVERQIAGLMVVPASDPLADPTSPGAIRLAKALRDLSAARRATSTPR